MNKITLNEIKDLSDQEILNLLKQYPYESQWDDKKAYEHAEYNLALQKGRNYLKTGDLKDLGLSVEPGFTVTGNAGKGKTIHALDDCLDERYKKLLNTIRSADEMPNVECKPSKEDEQLPYTGRRRK